MLSRKRRSSGPREQWIADRDNNYNEDQIMTTAPLAALFIKREKIFVRREVMIRDTRESIAKGNRNNRET